MTNKRLSILISGRVQGVFFRKSAQRIALRYGLTGTIANLSNGQVSLVAEGEEVALRRLLEWCYRGSFLAKVEGLSFEWGIAKGEYRRFTVARQGNLLRDELLAVRSLSKTVLKVAVPGKVPAHVVVIPDGNRRWAEEKNLPSFRGHQKGFERAIELLKAAREQGIRFLTMWGFSTENWSRDAGEVRRLMMLYRSGLRTLRKEAISSRVRFRHFGRKDRLPPDLLGDIAKLEADTARFSNLNFGAALDYGGRDEIVRAVAKLQEKHRAISEKNITQELDTADFPDPELIIRTSGEQRLSGIMPWQSVYAELYFSPVYFPDFDGQELAYALQDFAYRRRRFGQ